MAISGNHMKLHKIIRNHVALIEFKPNPTNLFEIIVNHMKANANQRSRMTFLKHIGTHMKS